MSYRLITKAVLTINEDVIDVEVRAYPAPKRPAAGSIAVNGVTQEYRTTGGKGRGLLVRNYVYTPLNGESAYFEVTEAQAAVIKAGAALTLTTDGEQAVTGDEPDGEELDNHEPAATVEPEPTPEPKATRKSRKAKA